MLALQADSSSGGGRAWKGSDFDVWMGFWVHCDWRLVNKPDAEQAAASDVTGTLTT